MSLIGGLLEAPPPVISEEQSCSFKLYKEKKSKTKKSLGQTRGLRESIVWTDESNIELFGQFKIAMFGEKPSLATKEWTSSQQWSLAVEMLSFRA